MDRRGISVLMKKTKPSRPKSLAKLALLLMAAVAGPGALLVRTAPPLNPENLWALVIGVSNYSHAEPLRYAASDADSFSQFLGSPRGGQIPPEHVFTLLEDQATRRAIEVELELMQDRVRRGDTVYIYVAGHGFINRRGLGYFIPSDGDLRVPASTSVSFSVLKEMVDLGLAQAERRILITDLCNSGRIGPERTDLADKIQNLINAELLKLGAGRPGSFLNLLASRPTEASWESDDLGRGVFTHTLLEALNGSGAAEGDLVVEAAEMVDYVSREVPKYTGNQLHPMANENFDPDIPLSFLDQPGPGPRATDSQTVLILTNVDKSPFRRVQWSDPGTQALAVLQLSQDGTEVLIKDVEPGELSLQFFDEVDQPRTITVDVQPGENRLDLLSNQLGGHPFLSRPAIQVAALEPLPVAVGAWSAVLQTPQVFPSPGDAVLMVRLQAGTDIYLDGDYWGRNQESDRLLQLRGLTRGPHQLRFVPAPDREHRFRVRLFSGPQLFDLGTGELRAVARVQPPPALAAVPAAVPPVAGQTYRDFLQALWEERLIQPDGNSAWDYYLQLQGMLPVALAENLKFRLVVAMGNRAQRIILKYLRGGDIRWNSDVFEEGETLVERTQTLFKETNEFESLERFFAGRGLIERANYPLAAQELRQSIDLDSEASHAHNALGLALWKQNLLQDAIPPLETAIDLSPRWNYPRITLALIYLELRQYQLAEQNLQEAIQVNAEDSTAYHAMGQLYSLLGRIQEAETQLLQATEMNPGNAYALETLGKLYQRVQRQDEAEGLFRLAIRLEPEEPSFSISLGELLQQMGRSQEAQPIFQRTVDQNPNQPAVLMGYAGFLAAAGQRQQAETVYRQALGITPEDANLRVRYGLFLQNQGRLNDAEREFRAAIRMQPQNPFAHYNLASLHLSRRNVSRAEGELQRAMEADPRLAAPPMLLAQIRSAQGRHAEALEQYRRALSLSIESHQRQQLRDSIDETEASIVAEKISQADQQIRRRRFSQAWSSYSETLENAPDNHDLRNAILRFQDEHIGEADVSALPQSDLTDVLKTDLWRNQLRAEGQWRAGQEEEAVITLVNSLQNLDPGERRLVTATWFNLRNGGHSVHQLIYRWGLRMVGRGDYQGVLGLLESATRHNVFAAVPDFQPLTVDSLMTPADVPQPRVFQDFEIAHHPDRRAHRLYAAANAGLGEMERAQLYLPAIENAGPDVETRLLMGRTLQKEQRWSTALSVVENILSNPALISDRPRLGQVFILAAEIRCQSGDCEAGRTILERGREILPDDRQIERAFQRLGF